MLDYSNLIIRSPQNKIVDFLKLNSPSLHWYFISEICIVFGLVFQEDLLTTPPQAHWCIWKTILFDWKRFDKVKTMTLCLLTHFSKRRQYTYSLQCTGTCFYLSSIFNRTGTLLIKLPFVYDECIFFIRFSGMCSVDTGF